jgi:hypothetical protein
MRKSEFKVFMNFKLKRMEELCECGDFKEEGQNLCMDCEEKSSEEEIQDEKEEEIMKVMTKGKKCEACYYFLDPTLCPYCNKGRQQEIQEERQITRTVVLVREHIIVPEHLVYNFRRHRINHTKTRELEDDSFIDNCQQE